MKVYHLINFSLVLLNLICAVNWIDLHGGSLSILDLLVQKSLRYKHHKTKFIRSSEEGIALAGLKIKKKPAFQPVSEYFEFKWNAIIFNEEWSVVQLLLYESERVIGKIEVEIQKDFIEKSPEKLKHRYADLEKKYIDLQRKLEQRRRKNGKSLTAQSFKRNNALDNTNQIIAGVSGSEVPSSVT